MLKISVDGYRKQTTQDYFRVLKLLELQAEWDQQDINELSDKIGELERENAKLRKEF